jgi:methylmalonyl-CoA mutase
MGLFEEFSPVTARQWKEQIMKDLKGRDFDTLIWNGRNHFPVHPFYSSGDLQNKPLPLRTESHWDACAQITVANEAEANRRALQALKGGASGLSFYIHRKIDTALLLREISVEHIYTQFFISNDALHVLDDLKEYYGKENVHDGKIKCFVNADPLSLLAFYGEWHGDEAKDLAVLKRLLHVPLNVSLYQEAGANTVNELAIGLAHLNEYFNYLGDQKALNKKAVHSVFSVNGDFFTEIAKLRAFRKLVTLLQAQYQLDLPLHVHAQTALQNKSALDAYSNMLRTTTEGMSAVIGGCDSLCVLPFNEGFDDASDFSSRIALNQQHIYREESYLGKVADMAAGSYYIENLTEQLTEKAWEQFKLIESKGGFIACLKNNFIQDLIANDAEELLRQVKEGTMILVGVNKYQNTRERNQGLKVKAQSQSAAKTVIQPIKPIRVAESFEKIQLIDPVK